MKERSQQNLLVQRKVFEHLLVVYVPKPKLRALQQQDISILKSAGKKTQPAVKMVIQEIHIVLIVERDWHMVKPLKKPDDGKVTKEPTCTANGVTTFTCIVCKKTKTRSIKATGHSYGEYVVVKEPTTTEKGLKSKTCSACGKVYSVTLAKISSSKTTTKTPTTSSQNAQTSKITTKKIKLNRKKLTLKKGKTFKFKVTLTPRNSRDRITYVTSNKKVVKVYRNGRIKALKKGKAKITVISGTKKFVCKVTVK